MPTPSFVKVEQELQRDETRLNILADIARDKDRQYEAVKDIIHGRDLKWPAKKRAALDAVREANEKWSRMSSAVSVLRRVRDQLTALRELEAEADKVLGGDTAAECEIHAQLGALIVQRQIAGDLFRVAQRESARHRSMIDQNSRHTAMVDGKRQEVGAERILRTRDRLDRMAELSRLETVELDKSYTLTLQRLSACMQRDDVLRERATAEEALERALAAVPKERNLVGLRK